MGIPGNKTEGTSDKAPGTASATPAVTPVSAAPEKAPTPAHDSPPVPFKNRVPAAWHIETGEEEGTIVAFNNVSSERFEGTIEAFNLALRG